MSSMTFSQVVCGGSLLVTGSTAKVSLFTNSGTAYDLGDSFRACDHSVDWGIAQRLWDQNIFNDSSIVASVGNKLVALGEYVGSKGFEYTALIKQQTEHVRIVNGEREIEDPTRHRSMGRVVIIMDSGHMVYQDIMIGSYAEDIVKEFSLSVERMLRKISELRNAPAQIPTSPTTVVFAPGAGGFFVHEVFGHMLEGDWVSKGLSVFGKDIHLGERIAPDFVNIVDDPSDHLKYIGMGRVDDEGVELKKAELVSEGILNAYLCHQESAESLGNKMRVGCARRQSYKHKAIPRMRATYVLPAGLGEDLATLIAGTREGFLASELIGGNVNSLTGDFMLDCGCGYLIENGQVTRPTGRVIMYGSVLSVLKSLDVIGDDLVMLPLQCAKAGQIVPVCVGSPAIRTQGIQLRGYS